MSSLVAAYDNSSSSESSPDSAAPLHADSSCPTSTVAAPAPSAESTSTAEPIHPSRAATAPVAISQSLAAATLPPTRSRITSGLVAPAATSTQPPVELEDASTTSIAAPTPASTEPPAGAAGALLKPPVVPAVPPKPLAVRPPIKRKRQKQRGDGVHGIPDELARELAQSGATAVFVDVNARLSAGTSVSDADMAAARSGAVLRAQRNTRPADRARKRTHHITALASDAMASIAAKKAAESEGGASDSRGRMRK
jgi:hypothetical protein